MSMTLQRNVCSPDDIYSKKRGINIHVDDVASNICWPLHRMTFNPRNEGSNCVSTSWRVVSAGHYPLAHDGDGVSDGGAARSAGGQQRSVGGRGVSNTRPFIRST